MTQAKSTCRSGERLIARGAIATEIIPSGQVRFVHANLHSGSEWVDPWHRPPGVTKGESLDLYYVWNPSHGWYVARRSE